MPIERGQFGNVDNGEYTAYFARENFRGQGRIFGIRQTDRRQHMYVIGKSGTGKTTLLKNLALQDVMNGMGIAVVDPHGEFVEEIAASIPPERLDDVVYVNPADADFPIGFNVLEVKDPQYKHLIAQDLMGIFKKIWENVWSARMEYIMANCVLALIDTPGSTLLGIPRILVDTEYRKMVVGNVRDPVVRSFWTQEYENYTDRLRSEAIVPIQNKVGQFLSTSLIRNIVGQSKSTIDTGEIMNSNKILLVNVSKGRIGEENAALLGALFITKIQLSAMERIRIPERDRQDFYLYVDEFQNFATESFASILSEARKYRLNLIVAHQYIGQLVTDTSTKVRDAIFGNVGTQIVFRVGAPDAEFLENEYAPEFDIQDLVSLPNRNIYLKLMVNGVTSRPFSAQTLPPIHIDQTSEAIAKITQRTRELYTRPRAEVELEIEGEASIFAAGGASASAAGAGAVPKGEVQERNGEFVTACSICGKEAKLPFKPDGKRPVYCSSCKGKIDTGELKPIPNFSDKKPFGDTLASLGIEFAPSKIPEVRKKGEVRPQSAESRPVPPTDSARREHQRQSVPAIRGGEAVRRSEPTHAVSLTALENKTQVQPLARKGPDMQSLRDALLKLRRESEGEQPKASPPAVTTAKPKLDDDEEFNEDRLGR